MKIHRPFLTGTKQLSWQLTLAAIIRYNQGRSDYSVLRVLLPPSSRAISTQLLSKKNDWELGRPICRLFSQTLSGVLALCSGPGLGLGDFDLLDFFYVQVYLLHTSWKGIFFFFHAGSLLIRYPTGTAAAISLPLHPSCECLQSLTTMAFSLFCSTIQQSNLD